MLLQRSKMVLGAVSVMGMVFTPIVLGNDNYPTDHHQGIKQEDPALTSGKLDVQGWVPIYIGKRKLFFGTHVWEEAIVVAEKKPDSLLAGCISDFNGDDRQDYLLVLQRTLDGMLQMHAFIAQAEHYRVMPISELFELRDSTDQSNLVGPQTPVCGKRPKSGIFQPFRDEPGYRVVGDVIKFGWDSYFWEGYNFRSVLSSD